MEIQERGSGSILRKGTSLPFVLAGVLLVTLASGVLAGSPEYMKLEYKVGEAYEIKGRWQEAGYLLATDLEPLPKPRRPKLRGEIQQIDTVSNSIVVYGRQIAIYDQTELVDDVADGLFARLKIGQRIEVSCKVDDDGHWKATRLRTKGVKNSNKVKGTLTRVMVDGNAPDTIVISGLIIVLERRTDINRPTSHLDRSEKLLFGDLAGQTAWGISDGRVLNDQIHLSGQFRQNVRSEGEYDLDYSNASDRSTTQPETRIKLQTFFGNRIRGLAKLRVRKRYTVASDQNIPANDLSAQIIELHLLARDIGGLGLALVVGRQDFDEPREWLFDEYLDAVRGYYYGTAPFIFELAYIHAVEPMKDKSATWTDIFAQAKWLISKEARASIYYLARKDSDIRNREPIWYGLRFSGRLTPRFQPWLDAALMKGTDKGETLDAWAFDLGTTITGYEFSFQPSLTVAYAFGSGDDTSADRIDHSFRQTGYQDDVDEFGGAASVPYYGVVLAPELSNLEITTVGLSVRPYRDASVELLYHGYTQHYSDRDLKGSDLNELPGGGGPAAPNGSSNDIGSAFDIIVALPTFWEPASLTWTFGWFFPGDAFGANKTTASLNKLNLTIGF